MNKKINSSISKVSHIHSMAADYLSKKLSEKGLPELVSSHGFILFQLSLQEKITMGELSKKINRDKSTTTVLVRKLTETGLVSIEKDISDKRNKFISLTEKGKQYNEITNHISQELIQTFFKDFTADEQQQFFNFLIRIENNFKNS
ncbi:MAG: MarR family transcriptional regulator [Treponema sp.]|nr:MarR family transcriptional regulator [Treponema sp.]